MIAVAAVVVVAAFALGLFSPPSNATGGGPMGTPISYDSAIGPAMSESQGVPGAPWTLVAAEGLGLASGITGPNPATTFGGGCTAQPAPGAPAEISLLGTPSNATGGEVAQWLFFATNASASAILLIGVTATAAVPIDLGTGSSCVATFQSLTPLGSAPVIDSTGAAKTFASVGGAAWAADHTVLTQIFVLEGPPSQGGSFDWVVSYSTCNIAASSGAGLQLIGAVDASTGGALGSPTAKSVAC